jgi:small subunit ribosomal protein S8
MQDTLSDMLVRIKNAQNMKHEDVLVFDSGLNRRVCDVLVEEGYIHSYARAKEVEKPSLELKLKYYLGKPVISNMKRVSKSSRRVYQKAAKIPRIVDGFGILVISTSKGIMSHLNAKKNNIGGEVLFWVN